MRSAAIILCAVIILVSFSQVQATIIHVPADQPTIQAGIDASSSGDTVLVAPDNYRENINFSGMNILVGSWFLVSGDSSHISSTVIDGDSAGPVVTFANGEDTTAELVGFSIRNGDAERGGGVRIDHSNPTIRNNSITGNIATLAGGVYCAHSSARILNNIISGNLATYRCGGIQCLYGSDALISDNLITHNEGTNQAGGIDCQDSDPLIIGNVITRNSCYNGGGIVIVGYSAPTIANNLIYANSARGWGGAIICDRSDPLITNTTISHNKAIEGGGAAYCNICNITIFNSILWDDSAEFGPEIQLVGGSYAAVTYSDVKGSYEGEGNINADPLFCDFEGSNYHLWNTSPCIGTGQGGSNMGAYGVGCVRGDANSDGFVNLGDVIYLLGYLYKEGPIPHPLEAGDVNCDEVVDLGDVVYLLNYLFKNGPPPCEP